MHEASSSTTSGSSAFSAFALTSPTMAYMLEQSLARQPYFEELKKTTCATTVVVKVFVKENAMSNGKNLSLTSISSRWFKPAIFEFGDPKDA